MLSEPVNSAAQAILQRSAGAKTEFLGRSLHIEPAPRLPVGPAGLPSNFAVESAQPGYHVHQIFDHYFVAGPDIDGFALVINRGGAYQRFRAIFDIKKLARDFS